MRMFFALLAAAVAGFAVTLFLLPPAKAVPAPETVSCGTPYCNVG